jgi:hypothetical protein
MRIQLIKLDMRFPRRNNEIAQPQRERKSKKTVGCFQWQI